MKIKARSGRAFFAGRPAGGRAGGGVVEEKKEADRSLLGYITVAILIGWASVPVLVCCRRRIIF